MPWFTRGLRNGVVTTGYPARSDRYAQRFPAAVGVRPDHPAVAEAQVAPLCPTGAIHVTPDGLVSLDRGRCILCRRCVMARPDVFELVEGAETATLTRDALLVPQLPETREALAAVRAGLLRRTAAFGRSLHVRHVDAGSDGADEWEVQALTNPVYDVHRLGIFFTASPRHADLLLVTGAGSRGMVEPLARTLQAMPRPLAIIAAGSDACSGGLVSPSYATSGGVGGLLPVDVWVPGSPPSPFSLLHGLLLALGRVPGGPAGGRP